AVDVNRAALLFVALGGPFSAVLCQMQGCVVAMIDAEQQDIPVKVIEARQRRMFAERALEAVIIGQEGGVWAERRERAGRVTAAQDAGPAAKALDQRAHHARR